MRRVAFTLLLVVGLGACASPVTVAGDAGDLTLPRRPERIVSLSATHTEILYALGRIQLGRRNSEKAREYLLAADERMPANPEILQTLILLDRQQDRLGESKARIAAALEAEPENGKLHQLAGVVAVIEERPDDAEESFRKAIEIAPDDLSGYRRVESQESDGMTTFYQVRLLG